MCLAECDGFSSPADKDKNCELGTCEEIHPCGCPLIYEAVCCDAECEKVKDAKNTCKEGECNTALCSTTSNQSLYKRTRSETQYSQTHIGYRFVQIHTKIQDCL